MFFYNFVAAMIPFAKTRVLLVLALLLAGAVPAVRAAQDGSDEVTPEVQRLYSEARTARQSGDAKTAIAKYNEMLKLAPHLAPAYNNLGMIYFDLHDYQHAATVLKRGMELNPNMPGTQAMLGMSYFQLGNPQKAQPLLESALRANPKDDQVEMVLAQTLVANGHLAEAAAHLKTYLERNPKNQDAWYMLGKTYLQLSEDALNQIDRIDPDSVVAHEIAGEIDQSMHNYDVALVEYKKAVDMAPNKPGTHMHLGDAFWNLSKWQSAQAEFREELKNDPNNCIARWKLANAMLEANDSTDQAYSELNNVIQRCPTLMQARVDRARALVRLGRQSEAFPDLQAAVQESPNEPSIHFLLAAVYRSQGKTSDAQKEMQLYSSLQRQASANVASQAEASSAIKNNAK